MDKDAYYFSHDSNAFHDPKIIKLRAKYGLEGYGFYWAVIEHLRNQPQYLLLEDDLDLLSFHLHSDESKIKQMLNTCLAIGLLETEDGKVFSESLLRRMDRADKIRKKRSDAGKMGGRPKANEKQNESKTKALKERKGKEKKEKEIEIRTQEPHTSPPIDPTGTTKPAAGKRYEFAKIYSKVKPFNPNSAEFQNAYFQAVDVADGEDVVNVAASMYVQYCEDLSKPIQYIPNAARWLDTRQFASDWKAETMKELEERAEKGDKEAETKYMKYYIEAKQK